MQYGFESPKNLTVEQSQHPTSYTIGTYFGTTLLKVTMDLGYLLNDIPTVTVVEATKDTINLPDGTELFAIDTPFKFCQPTSSLSENLTRWDRIYYDPSIQVIFGDLEAPATISPTEKKNKHVVAIVVPVVIVALIIIVVIIVVMTLYVPSVRNFFRPYNQEKVRNARETANRDTWMRSSTPEL